MVSMNSLKSILPYAEVNALEEQHTPLKTRRATHTPLKTRQGKGR